MKSLSSRPVLSELTPAVRRRAQLLIFIAIMATAMGQTVVFAVLGPLGREVGLNEVQIGTIITFSSIVFSAFSPMWGRRSDRVGRTSTMITGLLGYTGGTLLFASTFLLGMEQWLTGLWLFVALVVARCLQSMVMSATSPSATAYMADITDISQRTKGMGIIASAHSIGTILGPSLAALALLGLLAPLYFAALITLAGALCVWLWLPRLPPQASTGGQSARLRLYDPRILPYILVGVCLYTGFSMVQQTIAYYVQDVLQLPASTTVQLVGYAMMGSALAALFAQVVMVQKMKLSPILLLRLGLPLTMCGFFLLTLTSTLTTIMAVFALIGLGMGLCGPGFSALASLAVGPREQGAIAGLISACPALGFIIGPVLGGVLYQWQMTAPALIASLLFVPLVVFIWLGVKR